MCSALCLLIPNFSSFTMYKLMLILAVLIKILDAV